MTIGIYCLEFNNTDKVYIGQSRNIERRYSTHINNMVNNIANGKLQEAYNQFGIPKLKILLECTLVELNTSEIEAINIFNSINNGFNTSEGGGSFPVLIGNKNPVTKYSEDSIINAFNYIIDNPNVSLTIIATELNIHRSTIKNLNNGTSHKWLKDRFPEKYAILENQRTFRQKASNSLKHRNKPTYITKSPEGIEYTVENITQFAQDHNLNRGAFGNMLRGNTKHHKGWKVVR